MTDATDHAVPHGLADLPFDVRITREIHTQREIADGFMRRHVAEADFTRRYQALQYQRLLLAAPVIGAQLRKG